MKKVLTGSVIALMVLFLSMGLGLAGQGQGSGQGAGDGTGPIHDILSGTPFVYEGAVVSLASGQGLVLDIGETNVTVYGMGSARYWESVGVDHPGVGETVIVTGYTVDYNGEYRDIAFTIVVEGETVPLRDPETGAPLWRGQKKGQDQ